MPTTGVDIRVLGPVEVTTARGPAVIGPLESALLAVLVVNAGQVVSTGRLVECLWGDRAPASARNRVQALVSSARRALGPDADALATRAPGYTLLVDPRRYDAAVFESLVGRARAEPDRAERARLLGAALDLWRGPAFDGIAAQPVGAEAYRLDELRRAAREDRAEARLATGDHADLVAELTGQVAADPLRERLRGLLMLALYRSGRQAEALQVYDQGAAALAAEHGLDPGPELRRLRQAILTDDPAVAAEPARSVAGGRGDARRDAPAGAGRRAPAVPAQLPPPVAGFVGRAGPLARLDTISAAATGAPTVVISAVSGTAGVGKTALAVYWAHRAAARFPDGQLYVNLRGFDPGGSATDPAEAVLGFLDALEVSPARIPASLPARTALFRSLVAGRRMLVVLDNASDAAQVRPLLPGSPSCLVLVTSRAPLTGLVASEGAHPVPLDLLSDAEARDLLAARLGADRLAAEPAAGQEIVAGCARLPLALAIAAARVATEPTMSLATLVEAFRGERARLDVLTGDDPATDVRSVLSWSLRSLGPAAARLFRLLGLHPGPDIATAAAASLGGLPEPAARPVLAELVRARLLDEPTPGRFAFHDLLRAYAAELAEASDSAADRAAGVRRVLDHYLHTGHAAALRLEPYREPLTLGVPGEGVSPTLVADHAAALAWFDAERAALLAVIRHAAAAGRDAHAWQLVWTVTSYLDRRGLWREQAQVQEIALNAGHRLGDRAGEAHARRGLARAYCRLGRLDDAVPQLDAALDLFGALRDHAGQARVHLDLGWLYGRRDDPAGALRHAEAALALYRTANHHTGQARALNNASWYHCQVGDFAAALACCEEALALHLGAGDRHGQSAAWDSLGYIRAQLGDREDAVRCYGRALAMFREDGDRYDEATVLVHLGDVHATADDRATARRCWRDAVDIFDELDHPDGDRFRSRLADEDVPTLR